MMKIAVDAMGGDHAPQVVIAGVEKARDQFNDLEFLVFGDEPEIRKYLHNEQNIKIIHTTEVINNNDEPVHAIRQKKQASMVLAAKAVKNGDADALFSLGSTGALLASGLFIIGRIRGIKRPGLMPTMPTVDEAGKGFNILDVGANAENRPNQLYQFALMGSVYAQTVRGIANPRVGLLNNGAEEHKGDELHQEIHKLLAQSNDINFVGNVEADHLLQGVADVVVTDGFTGNATLKAIEGTAKTIMKMIKHAVLDQGLKEKIGALLIKNSLSKVAKKFDVSTYGGAVLLGINAPVIKAHGAADERTIFYTIKQIRQMLANQTIQRVVTYFDDHQIPKA